MCVERLGADGFGDRVLGRLSVFIDDGSIVRQKAGTYWTIGRATVSISALDVDEPHLGRSLVISSCDVCEGSTLC